MQNTSRKHTSLDLTRPWPVGPANFCFSLFCIVSVCALGIRANERVSKFHLICCMFGMILVLFLESKTLKTNDSEGVSGLPFR